MPHRLLRLLAAAAALALLLSACGSFSASSDFSGASSNSSVPIASPPGSASSFPAPQSQAPAQSLASSAPHPITLPEVALLLQRFVTPEYEAQLVYEQSKQERESLLPVVKNHLRTLVQGGMLPAAVEEQALPYLNGANVNFTKQTDNLGCVNLTCNFGLGVTPPYYLNFIYEEVSGRVFTYSFSLPFAHTITRDARRQQIQNYITYLGLDVLGDWYDYAPLWDEQQQQTLAPTIDIFGSPSAQLEATVVWSPDEKINYLYCGCGVQAIFP